MCLNCKYLNNYNLTNGGDKGKKASPEVRERISAAKKVKPSNCATRLRITVKDGSLVKDVAIFTKHGAHGLVHNDRAIQVIVCHKFV